MRLMCVAYEIENKGLCRCDLKGTECAIPEISEALLTFHFFPGILHANYGGARVRVSPPPPLPKKS